MGLCVCTMLHIWYSSWPTILSSPSRVDRRLIIGLFDSQRIWLNIHSTLTAGVRTRTVDHLGYSRPIKITALLHGSLVVQITHACLLRLNAICLKLPLNMVQLAHSLSVTNSSTNSATAERWRVKRDTPSNLSNIGPCASAFTRLTDRWRSWQGWNTLILTLDSGHPPCCSWDFCLSG